MSDREDNDLLNYYPDLSDDEEEQAQEELPGSQPHKIIKTNSGQGVKKEKTVLTAPLMFGGKAFLPPPPPPGAKKYTPAPPPPPSNYAPKPPSAPSHSESMPPRPASHDHAHQPQPRPERKNCLYVRNIPKHYNEPDKLMTFFKNEGQIKQIKVKHEENSAMVRFIKEENALRFFNSKKPIFNRSFITYSLNQKDTVPSQLIKEREDEEAGKFKKPVQVQMKQIKERLEAILADKIRALLFLLKHSNSEQANLRFLSELHSTTEQKNSLSKLSYEEISEVGKAMVNEYDWTIGFSLCGMSESAKRLYINSFPKRYGPLSFFEVTPIAAVEQTIQALLGTTTEEAQQPHDKLMDFIVKVCFLSPKLAWQFYYLKQLTPKSQGRIREEKALQIEGIGLKSLINEGIIKIPTQLAEEALQHPVQEQPQVAGEMVEIDEHGEVRVVKEAKEQDKPGQAGQSHAQVAADEHQVSSKVIPE